MSQSCSANGPIQNQEEKNTEMNITEKINALIAHAESTAHEGERNAFLDKATELMAEHALSLSDLEDSKREAALTKLTLHHSSGFVGLSLRDLIQCIADSFGVFCYRNQGKKGMHVGLVGSTEAIVSVISLYARLEMDMMAQASEIYGVDGGETRVKRNAFLQGYVRVISARLRTQMQQRNKESGNNLLPVLRSELQKNEEAAEEITGFKFRVSSTQRSHSGSLAEGLAAGLKANLGNGSTGLKAQKALPRA